MTSSSPLLRKIGPRRSAGAPPPLTVSRVWRRAVSHGFTRAIGLETVIEDVIEEPIAPEEIARRAGPGALAVLLDGPHGYGVAIVSHDLLAAMLEVQTLGRVQTRKLSARPVTATDAAMVADPIDRVLTAQETLVAELPPKAMASGYRYATRVENLVEIALSLEDEVHDLFSISVTAGPGGPRNGRLDIVLPRCPKEPVSAAGESREWGDQIEARVLGAEVVLRAELARLSLSVGEIEALGPGDTLTLGRHSMGAVRLVAQGNHPLCFGRLGQSAGRKAVRIGEAVPQFTEAEFPRASAPRDIPGPNGEG
ncbi:FliM/FliN family flagellar motor switch protein [Palleronia sp. LCG004]|uniref:FliM/FliN family flagellar motor switch protein n=1 Tax=Palleronia sp. LCG004 TaxID=3079304 RepID=UPI002943A570|nr:FliM/FliN family flagellar motor switch protein [Palleronia sp. LCG004]WOI55272.1 FliM/FliN family flagellar motor switch protein [Palleronia sp. LCG004]